MPHPVYECCVVSGYNSTISGNLLPAFRDNISAPSSGVKNLAYKYIHKCYDRLAVFRQKH
jgi:hypothetical protein